MGHSNFPPKHQNAPFLRALPGVSGYEVASQLRRRPEFDNVTLVAVTGWGQEKDRNRTRELGFNHHLVKPVDPTALETLLAAVEP